jgi:hypothetical protein
MGSTREPIGTDHVTCENSNIAVIGCLDAWNLETRDLAAHRPGSQTGIGDRKVRPIARWVTPLSNIAARRSGSKAAVYAHCAASSLLHFEDSAS